MRFYNSGQYLHQVGRHKDTGEMVESIKDLKSSGRPVGMAIVKLAGSNFHREVASGEWVDIPDDIFGPSIVPLSDEAKAEIIKRACPSLLTEAEAADVIAKAEEVKAAAAPAKASKKDKE